MNDQGPKKSSQQDPKDSMSQSNMKIRRVVFEVTSDGPTMTTEITVDGGAATVEYTDSLLKKYDVHRKLLRISQDLWRSLGW